MIARFNWQRLNALRLGRRKTRTISWNVWWLVGGLTFLMVVWVCYRVVLQPAWLELLPPAWEEMLALTETAGAFTLSFLWAALTWRRWRAQAAPPLPLLEVADLYALSPAAFEKYVALLFRQKGYRVKLRGGSGDLGVDLEVMQRRGKKAIVQCKRYQHTVGPDVVRELYGTLIHEKAAHAFLVTTAEISEAAEAWADGKPITLIDGTTLVQIATALHRE